jgi:hypothetical protein
MGIFKTNKELFDVQQLTPGDITPPPLSMDCNYSQPLKIKDIEVWEEIYRQPGNIGIYAAWSPYAEFYLIIHELFFNFDQGIEIFSGEYAMSDIMKRSKEFGIDLPVNKIWTNSWRTPPANITY